MGIRAGRPPLAASPGDALHPRRGRDRDVRDVPHRPDAVLDDFRSQWPGGSAARRQDSGEVDRVTSALMKVLLLVNDFLDRAETVFGDRIGVIDEPTADDNLGDLTYAEVARRVR